MKNILRSLCICIVIIAAGIPAAPVFAYEEGDVQVFYNDGGDWIEIDPADPVIFTDYFQLKVVLNTGEAVDIWTMAAFNFAGWLEGGESAYVGYTITGSGSSQYSGEVVTGMDAPDAFTQASDPGGQFYITYGPAQFVANTHQYITWQLTDNGGLPSTAFYSLRIGNTGGDITGPVTFEWGVLGYNADCDDSFQIQEAVIASQEIDATDEDGEYAEVEEGSIYRLEVWGGPWDDGTDPDRYDTAVSFDGEEWIPLTEYFAEAACYDVGDEHPETGVVFFESPGTDFYIRVNDEAEQFADNDGSMVYSLSLAIYLEQLFCSDQFTWDDSDALTSYEILATDEDGVEVILEEGEWYVFENFGGPWYDGSNPNQRFSIALYNPITDEWEPMTSYTYHECAEESQWGTNYVAVYIQAPADEIRARVNDTGGVFSDNSGGIRLIVYAAEYDRFLTSCEQTMDMAALIEKKYADAKMENGILVGSGMHDTTRSTGGEGSIELIPMFALETIAGPWISSGTKSWDGALQKDDDGWYNIEEHPEMVCVAEVDKIGHVIAYYQVHKPYDYYFRVDDDGTWSTNTGSLGYELYEAWDYQIIDPEGPLEPGTCDMYYDTVDMVGSITVSATNSTGVYLPAITEYDTVYAIITAGGPWNDGTDDRYDVQITNDDGLTWEPLDEFSMMACGQTEDEDYVRVYVVNRKGNRWKVKVNDTPGDFGDNSGSMTIQIWSTEDTANPWSTCSDNYELQLINIPEQTVAGINSFGGYIPYNFLADPGTVYAIQIKDGPWYEGDDGEWYDTQVSDDKGGSWLDLDEYGICAETVGDENEYIRMYFTPTAASYSLRVNDKDDNFLNNGGSVSYWLWRAVSNDVPDDPDDPDLPYIPPEWDASCYGTCPRPASVFSWKEITIPLVEWEFQIPFVDVAGWLEYGRCGIQSWLSWCPDHTAAMTAFPEYLSSREPFYTVNNLLALYTFIGEEIDNYGFTQGGEMDPDDPYIFGSLDVSSGLNPSVGPVGGEGPIDVRDLAEKAILPPLDEDSFWNGGGLDLELSDPSLSAWMMDCDLALKDSIGSVLSTGLCWAYNMTAEARILTQVMFFLDVIAIVLFGLYIVKLPRRFGTIISGG